jgi:hypothetical protein
VSVVIKMASSKVGGGRRKRMSGGSSRRRMKGAGVGDIIRTGVKGIGSFLSRTGIADQAKKIGKKAVSSALGQIQHKLKQKGQQKGKRKSKRKVALRGVSSSLVTRRRRNR